MKIENIELKLTDIHSPVTYIPVHANGNPNHPDAEQGVIISFSEELGNVKVLYCKSRTIQSTYPEHLVWG